MVLGGKWHWAPAIVTGVLCNGIACHAYGTITGVEVLALLGRARGFMAEVGHVHSQVGEEMFGTAAGHALLSRAPQ